MGSLLAACHYYSDKNLSLNAILLLRVLCLIILSNNLLQHLHNAVRSALEMLMNFYKHKLCATRSLLLLL